ncbi:CLUMA_CG021334, isoform A [Clunio marinus]|uniref:Probable arginine--tRNA ligase, cytoplasmic n=1 Tax=Clunio marinus TaxID=568069 RepID=A0A1J1JBZ5_9DIPT|nr:CLUMA_CG021334, isoform A [Clunio marinus]
MSDQLQKEEEKLSRIETEINDIDGHITNIKTGNLSEESDELAKLLTENTKLKFRLEILKKAIANERKNCKADTIPSEMISIRNYLNELFGSAIKAAYPELSDPPIVITESTKVSFGDYQCNSAMPVSQLLKAKNIKASPRDVAVKILENLPNSFLINKTEIAGPGFINIFITNEYVVSAISTILKNGVFPPTTKKMRVVIDFSSPNVAKQMHVGHLRSTIIGESISRLLEFVGHDVLRLNHIGDWGTQFGMLIAHLEEMFPNYVKESPPIADLQAFYKESKIRFDNDEEFKKRAYDRVVKLQSGESNSRKAWQLICDVSRLEYQKVYKALDVTLEERGESFYQSRMENLVKELNERGFLEEDEGRKIMWGIKGEDYGGIPLTIIKSDGGFTYDTSDMATIRNRIEEEKGEWLVYVTDAGQSTHFKSLFSCARKVGILDSSKVRVDHVPFGVVLGEDGKKFKTRSGETVKLLDLLDEGLKRSLEKLKEKERDKFMTAEELRKAQENIAYGCIKYADLSKNRQNEYVFSFDKMLDDKGNTAVYLLYAYTRIKSIARNCGEEFIKNFDTIKKETKLELTHEKELKLAKVLIQFPDIIEKILKDLHVHYMCEFLYQISTTFTEFYDVCYCIEKNRQGEIVKINKSRILLCEATATVMAKCFDILGLKTLDKI